MEPVHGSNAGDQNGVGAPRCLYFLLYFSLILLIFLYVHALIRMGRRRRRRRLPPCPPRLPLLGNLHQLGEVPHVSFRSLSDKYGPLMHLQLGQAHALVVSSAEAAREVLKTRDLSFCSRYPFIASERFSYGGMDIGLAPYSEAWRQLRKLATLELFSARRVQSFRPVREEEVRVLVGEVRRAGGRPVNLSEMMLCLFNNITCREVFGERCSGEGECRRSRFHELVLEAIRLLGGFCAGDFFPSMEWLNVLTGSHRRLEKAFGDMDRLMEEEIAAHSGSHGSGRGFASTSSASFIDLLLHLRQKSDLGFPLSTEHVKGILMDFFLAGSDTSAASVEWAMSELIRNPTVMQKAQDEVRGAVAGEEVEESDLPKLQYLKLVVKEVLRLHPPASLLPARECREDCEVHGYEVPAKTMVYVNVWAIHRDPGYWEEPETFRPERFEGSSVDYKGQHFQYLPFGAGRRSCPGMALGVAALELALASLLYSFDWKLPEGVSKEDLDMAESFGIVSHRKTPLILVATPRVLYNLHNC
ncbi:hypothetical protein Taro_054307 [Colocasia esculenta]|uniref:Cytochrome P450 n=1 Tax=Colocasia esculenta TaxID=4460 RepID=A0A843XQ68_COLES|nr:hypothetical protein [Colocasia esculenta]